jgi:hypothetical protein
MEPVNAPAAVNLYQRLVRLEMGTPGPAAIHRKNAHRILANWADKDDAPSHGIAEVSMPTYSIYGG